MKYKATILSGSEPKVPLRMCWNLLKTSSSDGGGNFHNFHSQTITRQLWSAKATRFWSNNVSHSGLCLPDSPSNGRQPLANRYERVHGSTSVPLKLTFSRFDRVKLNKPRNYPRFELRFSSLVHLHAERFFSPSFFFFFSLFPTRRINCFCEFIELRATRLQILRIHVQKIRSRIN